MLCILLVDDNPNDRLIATRELKQAFPDVEIRPVIDLKSLQQALESESFDLVITDYRLGWSDGLSVLRAVKARHPDCPVIMFTDSGSEEVAVEGMKSGLSDYVLKNRQVYRLPIAVRESLEKQRLRQQYAIAVEQLRLSEERLRLALVSAQMGTWDWNLVTGQIVWSESYEQLLGLESGASAETYEAFLACVDPDDRTSVEQTIATASSQKTDYTQEFRVRWADGSSHWLAGRGKFFSDNSGRATRMIGIIWDITDRKQAEVERSRLLNSERAARETAETANRVKDEFLATLSHELRSPLSAILGWSKLLRSSRLNEDTLSRAIETIERNAQLQTQLIEDLLDISRIIQGKLHLNISPINLVLPIEAAIDTIRLAADAKNLKLQARLDHEVGSVSGDPNRLQQMVWNLLSNAVKFTPPGGRIEIRLERVDAEAQITVSDTGKGIRPDFLPYIFDSFRQADSSTTRSYGGLGLGLAIVRHLIELHGGHVWAESQGEGQGARFTVRLPLIKPDIRNLSAERQPVSPTRPVLASLQGVQVLIVDDETDSREFLEFVLVQQGATVTSAASAREALELIQSFTPDVLVSDIGMPGEDGYTFLRQVRSLVPDKAAIPALALTAYAREEDRNRALAAGFQQHLTKPVEPDVFVEAIANLVNTNPSPS